MPSIYNDLTVKGTNVYLGPGPIEAKIETPSGQINVYENNPWAPTDLTKGSWILQLDGTNDKLLVQHRIANAAAGSVSFPLEIRNDDKTYCILGNGTVNGTMLARAASIRAVSLASTPGNWSVPAFGTWCGMATLPTLYTDGGVLLLVSLGWCYFPANANQNYIYMGIQCDGVFVHYIRCDIALGARIPLPTVGTIWHWAPAVGNHSYTLWAHVNNNAGNVLTSGETGQFMGVAFS